MLVWRIKLWSFKYNSIDMLSKMSQHLDLLTGRQKICKDIEDIKQT